MQTVQASRLRSHALRAWMLIALFAMPAFAFAATTIVNTSTASFVESGVTQTVPSNTVTLNVLATKACTPSTATFYEVVPSGTSGAVTRAFDGGSYTNNSSIISALNIPAGIANPAAVPTLPASVYHAGNAVLIQLSDANRNLDPNVRETVQVTVRTSYPVASGMNPSNGTADEEILTLQETGNDTGVFAAAVPSNAGASPTLHDGQLTLAPNAGITLSYTDTMCLSNEATALDATTGAHETASASARSDPLGVVFDSSSGDVLPGSTLTLMQVIGGAEVPAQVYADDGVTLISNGNVVVADATAGSYRFPYVPAGIYVLHVTPPTGYVTPSQVPQASLPLNADGVAFHTATDASYAQQFTLLVGGSISPDIPADSNNSGLILQKTVSTQKASAGDTLQYRLMLQNTRNAAASTVVISDVLPSGFRYRTGSLKVGSVKVADPTLSANGRTMTIALPAALAANATMQITYVVTLSAGVVAGRAVNTATATANGGALTSNKAQAVVQVTEPFNNGKFTIIGRVFIGDCDTPFEQRKGLPNARLMMEDGSYVVTDADGQYHFEQVRPGTHVVQLDTTSLPKGYKPLSCEKNTRFAGSAISQFVEAQGGSLWRADFQVVPPHTEAGMRLETLGTTESDLTEPAVQKFNFYGNFASGKDALSSSSTELRDLLKQIETLHVLSLEVVGHTDNQKLSGRAKAKYRDNVGLSEARAQFVANYLGKHLGLPAEQITVKGVGADQPVADDATEEGRARNRRVEVIVHADVGVVKVGERVRRQHRLTIDSVNIATRNVRVTVMLPAGLSYAPGLSQLDGQPLAEPEVGDGMLVWRIDDARMQGAQHVLTFDTDAMRRFIFHGEFDPAQAVLLPDSQDELKQLTEQLGQTGALSRLEITGYTDDKPLSVRMRKQYADNNALSLARAQNIADALSKDLDLNAGIMTVEGHGERAPIASNKTEIGRARNRRIELDAYTNEDTTARTRQDCANSALKALVSLDTSEQQNVRLPLAVNRLNCGNAAVAQMPAFTQADNVGISNGADENANVISAVGPNADSRNADSQRSSQASSSQNAGVAGGEAPTTTPANDLDSGRLALTLKAPPPSMASTMNDVPSNNAGSENADSRRSSQANSSNAGIASDNKNDASSDDKDDESIAAAGGGIDWTTRTTGATGFLFPEAGHNPRAPAQRIVIEHAQGQRVELAVNGAPADGLHFDGVSDAPNGRAVSVWRGLHLQDGDNTFSARVLDRNGAVIGTFERVVHYANMPTHAEILLDKSVLIADGITHSIIAVKLTDKDGHPVRAGVSGAVQISAPYQAWQSVAEMQRRQLAGMDSFKPQFAIKGDDGIAYIELAPTTQSGEFTIDFDFLTAASSAVGAVDINTGSNSNMNQLHGWMKSDARDWVVVGFAEGTTGYNTLKKHMQSDVPSGTQDKLYTDGQISLYAKGRVLGKWLLTMAYDNKKARTSNGTTSVLSPIDPTQYYTLYGDGARPGYDAVSQSKLYVKMERGQFYALFGDYDTGLNKTQLSRYSRTLNGLKVENAGGPVVLTAYAADVAQTYARDEIQGNGTSGLYRLSQRDIVLNSERVTIETRDRLHPDVALKTQSLAAHLDYEIDYAAGTIYFKQPVNAEDTDFNPQFIVVEYETNDINNNKQMNGGGRVGVNLAGGKLNAGITGIHDSGLGAETNLLGADTKWKINDNTEFRAEVAKSNGSGASQTNGGDAKVNGDAWLAELEHHSTAYDALAYARRQGNNFGVGQQSLSQQGLQKAGIQGRVKLSEHWSLQGETYDEEDLNNSAEQQALAGKAVYQTQNGGVNLGAQTVHEQLGNADTGAVASTNGQNLDSNQLVLGVNRYLLDHKLQLTAEGESALNSGNNQGTGYPDRVTLGANYAVTEHARMLVGQEFTDGDNIKASTTRVGFEAEPWAGGRLNSTMNQTDMSENGQRTFGQLGLAQTVLLGKQWSVDGNIDSTHTFNKSSDANAVAQNNVNTPAGTVFSGSSAGTSTVVGSNGMTTLTTNTEDYVALSGGATYRTDLWSWANRLEYRNGSDDSRYGITTGFLRQAQAGIAFSANLQAFHTADDTGSNGNLATLDLSWAFRPLGTQWSILDRATLRYEDASNTDNLYTPDVTSNASTSTTAITSGGTSVTTGLYGFNSLSAQDATSRRLINNFALNHVSSEWTGEDEKGNLFNRYERSQWSLFYGAKYSADNFDGVKYAGYTDMFGLEARYDVLTWMDIGLQASEIHSWATKTVSYSYGPQIGFSPIKGGWITLGWNFAGFYDRDFDQARYATRGIYLQLRFKFDQTTKVGDRTLGEVLGASKQGAE